jgi:hypothetical protein
VPGGERGRLVQEEELRELARLHEPRAVPAAELEPARDPALAVVAPTDPPPVVVEAAAVPVDEAARRVDDQLAPRRHAVCNGTLTGARPGQNDDDRKEALARDHTLALLRHEGEEEQFYPVFPNPEDRPHTPLRFGLSAS